MLVDCRTVNNLAVAHVQHSISIGSRIRVVSNHHNRLPQIFVELAEQIQDCFRAFRVEVSGRLIGENDFRLADDCTSERDALLLAA
jgi:hypothetical protein